MKIKKCFFPFYAIKRKGTHMDLETWKRVTTKVSKAQISEPNLRANVPHNFAGSIVGFKGCKAKKIQEVHNVFLSVYPTMQNGVE
jgi:hypothetical protein